MNLARKPAAPLTALLAALFLAAPASFAAAPLASTATAATAATTPAVCRAPNTAVYEYAQVIEKVRREQPDLAEALRLFPKGGDLHNHLSGTVQAEKYLVLGRADGVCYGRDDNGTYSLDAATSSASCADGYRPLAAADAAERDRIVQSLSMYRFGYPDTQAGHDHFFGAFARFRAVSDNACNTAPMLAEVLRQSHADGVSYVETMLSFQSAAVGALTKELRRQFPDVAAYRDERRFPELQHFLLRAGLPEAVKGARAEIAQYVNRTSGLLGCGGAGPDPACGVSYAFLATVNRTTAQKEGVPDLAKVFTQAAFSMLLASTEKRVAGVNLLSKEDAPVSLAGFRDQMRIFGFLHRAYPEVNVALHAGELTPCFVGMDHPALKEHLAGSLQAGAKRIGHGVSFAYLNQEDQSDVARLFREKGATVEIMFTSNAQILGVAGAEHPFPQYRSHGVPVVFATDDEGVSHANFTDEWIYGFKRYGLTGKDLESLGRGSLQYSFMPGTPLWADLAAGKPADACAGERIGMAEPSQRCKEFLKGSVKAAAQWEYEGRLEEYWRRYGKKYGRYFGVK